MPRRFAAFLAFAAAAGLACAVAVELTLRTFPGLMSVQWQLRHPTPQPGPPFVVIADKELGYVNPVTPAGDRYGFPNREPWPEDPSIVFLGDSFLGGAFPQLIARALPGDPVLNLGMASAGLERQFLIYRRFGSQLHPRLVVAALVLSFDFENDAAFREWLPKRDQIEWVRFRNTFAAEQRGEQPYIDVRTALRTRQFRRLLDKSRLYTRAHDLVGSLGSPYPDTYSFPDGTKMLLDEFTVRFAAAIATKSDPRIDLLVASMERLRDLVAKQGAELLVMLIPSKEELFGVPPVAAESNVIARTRERLQEANYAVLDLYRTLREGGSMHPPHSHFPGDIHLNELGNRLVADAFLDWFKTHYASKKQ